MIVSRKRSPLQTSSHPFILSKLLDRVPEFKYLGVWLTEKLTWSKHIENITKTAARLTGMVYRKFDQHRKL